MRWEVAKHESGMKLADFLKSKLGPSFSSKQIKRTIDQGQCVVNGLPERFSGAAVGYGDEISFEAGTLERVEGDILYEDDSLLIYNKPAGTTVDALEKKLKQRLVHRLDKDTTGALILAKRNSIFEAMVQQFKGKEVQKVYWAIVDGVPQIESGAVENYLGKLKEWQGQSLWGAVEPSEGVHALTYWKRLRKGPQCALMECIPVTGRTHQIRVHLAGMGHPILGDKQYGRGFRCHYPAARTLLHAAKLSFSHPVSHNPLVVEAPMPGDFDKAIADLWKDR